ncbi:aminotransferase class I/II-fold pyridoxal phosphate-dependent enzyme [Cupriavidus basilensis]|uniref:Aminotransferase class I/II-fold pyridoxal phosphate-dependent enzyme n=1 Tax=Cupriavidus basilensis TaxID=68895 RepID=A0ABT6B2S8_9BURK|nr:aminotransferase class I/II-fold pyridoxal phosphate-dependent enzyme [Cupriavidus basilensis]MDF3838256.1 aminotransferase class I/II-fold pyridoxal phosphate-dependent enzyme [Cupriavidus basilensis]
MSQLAKPDDQTLCVQHPAVSLDGYQSFSTPVYRASTIVFDTPQAYRERAQRSPDGYTYGLSGTPTSRTLEAQLSSLNGAVRTIIVPSGQAAISALMLTVLKAGDHVLLPDNVYPPVKQFASELLVHCGVATSVYDPLDLPALERAADTERTRLIWIESPGSTSMEVSDIPAIVRIARSRGIMTGCDNTWATALYCKPLQLGVDVVAEALTKYVGGHSDLLLGSLSFADIELYGRVRRQLANLGVGVSPDDCSLALRGIETMGVRLERVGKVAADFAQKIEGRAGIAEVLHPALPTSASHALWQRDFAGSSGVFTLRLAGTSQQAVDRALGELQVFAIGASWGGTRSLIAPMSLANDRSFADMDRDAVYLRISIGLESPSDLWRDLENMLNALADPSR